MKQYGFIYNNFEKLKSFIENKNINETDTVLIQIMCGIVKDEFIKNLINEILILLPSAEIIGATTSGEIYEGNIYEGSIVLSFTIFEKSRVQTALINNESNEYELGVNIAKEFIEQDTKLMIMFSDGLITCGDNILDGIKSVNSEVIICGGKAGDNNCFKETFVFAKEGVQSRGIAVAFISGNYLNITTESSFGWSGIGKEMTITKADNNKIITIDNIKAEDIFKRYLGDDVFINFKKFSTTIPLIIKKESQDIARAAFDCNDDGSLSFHGKVEIGDKVQFGHADIKNLIDRPIEILNNLKDKSIQAIFIYSCSVRRALMDNSIAMEVAPFTQIAPTFGLFTYGEFFSTSCSSWLLNTTMTILGVSEGEEVIKNSNIKFDIDEILGESLFKDKNFITNKMISNLVKEVTKDLKEANKVLEEQKNKIEKVNYITNSIMDINVKIISSEEFDGLLQVILDKALSIIEGSGIGSILLMKNGRLHYTATKGYFLEKIKEMTYKLEDIYQYKVSRKYGMCEPIIISEVDKYPIGTQDGNMEWRKMIIKKPNEILTCGISVDGKFMGIINIFNTEKHDKFNEDDKLLIKHLANNISIAYKSSMLLESTLYMSRHDGLTGLFNRHYFRKKLVQVINKAKSLHDNIIICELDLNYLKVTNDTFGHEAGDLLIKYFSTIFKAGICENDIMGRAGGDEFEVVFINKSKSEVIDIINRIYEVCKNKYINIHGKHIEISFAYGLAELYSDSENIGELLKIADNRMYENKRRMKEKLKKSK